MKFGNKQLAIIFFVLLGIWITKTYVFKPSKRSFKEFLVQVDTSSVNRVILYPEGESGGNLSLTRSGSTWEASNGSLTVKAKSTSVRSILGQLVSMSTKQLVSKSVDKHADYEVDAQTGKIVEVYQGDKLIEKFVVGRFNFNQNTRQAVSYARNFNEDDIYSIDGFMSMSFNTDFNSFRVTSLLNFSPTDVKSVDLNMGGQSLAFNRSLDNSFVSNEGQVIDSTAMTSYLSSLSNLSGSDFNDAFNPTSAPSFQLNLVADNATTSLEIDIYNQGSNENPSYVIKSSQNEAYFDSDDNGIFKTIISDYLNLVAPSE